MEPAIMRNPSSETATRSIESHIITIRGQRVILDSDLADLYGVQTKVLNQALKRNLRRFPKDFLIKLSEEEWDLLKSQFVTSKTHGGRRTLPYAFTEHGAIMVANILRSEEAERMSVYVVRAFIKQREVLLAKSDVLKRLAEMDAKLLQHDDTLKIIWQELQPLLASPKSPPRRKAGFHP